MKAKFVPPPPLLVVVGWVVVPPGVVVGSVVVGGLVVWVGGGVVVCVGGGVVVVVGGGACRPIRANVVKCVTLAETVLLAASTELLSLTQAEPFHQAIYRLFSVKPAISEAE